MQTPDSESRLMLVTSLILAALLQTSPPVGKKQQAPAEQKENSAEQATPSPVPTPQVVNNVYSSDKGSKPKEKSKWWPPPPAWDIYWPTLGLLAFGAIAACIALRTLRDIKQQTENARTSAEAAKVSADAALLSAQALVNAERAWVTAELVLVTGTDYLLKLTNHGRTPAQVISYQFWVACPLPDIRTFPENPNNTFTKNLNILLVNAEERKLDERFDIAQYLGPKWAEVVTGSATGAFKILVKYHDLIKRELRETEVVYSYNRMQSTLEDLPWLNRYT